MKHSRFVRFRHILFALAFMMVPSLCHGDAQALQFPPLTGKVIPFLYDSLINPYPVVQISVNGKPPLPFIVDTGSSDALSLNPWAAKKLGLKTDGPSESPNGISFTLTPIRSAVFQGSGRNDDAAFDLREADVVDLSLLTRTSFGPPIAGIVGLGMLMPVTSRFDFAAKTLTIFASLHPPLHIPGGTVVPLRSTSDGLLTVRAIFTPSSYADLIVDTGSDETQVPLSALRSLHPTATEFNSAAVRLDGVYVCPEMRLPELVLESLSIPNVVVGTLPTPTRLSLGMDILAGYCLTLDGPNKQLTLEPSVHSGRYVLGWSDINVMHIGDAWFVGVLSDRSPARLAGLQPGDDILTVSGMSVKGLTQFQVEHLLGGIAGVPLQVTVQKGTMRQGTTTSVSWVPLDHFSIPHDLMYGLAMKKAADGPWMVTYVIKGCPGDKAGLQEGDKLTQIHVEQSSALLEVERTGVSKPFTVRLSPPK